MIEIVLASGSGTEQDFWSEISIIDWSTLEENHKPEIEPNFTPCEILDEPPTGKKRFHIIPFPNFIIWSSSAFYKIAVQFSCLILEEPRLIIPPYTHGPPPRRRRRPVVALPVNPVDGLRLN